MSSSFRRTPVPSMAYLLPLFLLLGLGLPSIAAAETFEVDKAHSFFMFRALRMGVANIYGRFNDFSGHIDLEGEAFESASIELEVRTDSVDTGIDRRDAHLRSPDFFNATQLPVITFHSTSIVKTPDGRFEVSGELGIHGVTKPVTALVELVGRGEDPRNGARLIGFDGTLTLKRSDFGMGFMVGPVSDEILIHLAVQAVSK